MSEDKVAAADGTVDESDTSEKKAAGAADSSHFDPSTSSSPADDDDVKPKGKKKSGDDDSVKSDDSDQSLRSKNRARLLLKGAGQSFRKILGRDGVKKKQESIRDIEVAVAGGGAKKVALDHRKTHLTRQARSLREIGTHNGKPIMNKRNARSMRHVSTFGIKTPDK